MNHKLCHRFTLRINKQYFTSLKLSWYTGKHFLIALLNDQLTLSNFVSESITNHKYHYLYLRTQLH